MTYLQPLLPLLPPKERPNGDWAISGPGFPNIAVIDSRFISDNQARELAHLFAASPDLLEALTDAYSVLADVRNHWPGRTTGEGQRLLCRMRDAIAGATGQDAQSVQDAAAIARAEGDTSPVSQAERSIP